MYRLFEFIRRIYVFVLFLLLEIGAIYIYAISDSHTQAKILGYSAKIIGPVGDVGNSIHNYFKLKHKNELLMNRIVELESRLSNLESIHSDSLLNSLSFTDGRNITYRAAHIVSNTINKRHNYMMINRGLQDDIRAGMSVVTPEQEVVGIVMECSDNFSIVMSILNTKLKLSGELDGSSHAGSIYWEGDNRYQVKMRELSKYATINSGDKVVTTGFSHIFPAGVTIGHVVGYELDREQRSYIVDIKLSADISAVKDVLVINDNRFAESRHMLENITNQ